MKDFASYEGKSSQDWEKEAKGILEAYAGKSEETILRAVYARAVEGKKNGTLTNEQIDDFYARFSPMLDSGRKKKLKKLVEQLKRM